jgi:hypothetical protein
MSRGKVIRAKVHGLRAATCKHGREWVQNPVSLQWFQSCVPPDRDALAQGRYEPVCACQPPKDRLHTLLQYLRR